MALPQVSPGLLPAENYRRFNLAFAAIDDAAGGLAGLAQQLVNTQTSITNVATDLAKTEERAAGATVDIASLGDSLAGLAQQLAAFQGAVDRLASELRDQDATATADIAALQSGKAALDAFQAAVDRIATAEASLAAARDAVARNATVYAPAQGRPGDVPSAFCAVSTLAAMVPPYDALPPIPPDSVAFAENGNVVRMSGAGIIASRQAIAVEWARVYRPRYVVQRRVDPTDPSNDAVRLLVLWFDQGQNLLPGADAFTVVEELDELLQINGRVERFALFGRAGAGESTIIVPQRARYALVAVQFFGPDHTTDCELLALDDVSDATLLDPISGDVAARVGALETANLPARTAALEAQVSGPKGVTYASRGDAAAASIPETVSVVTTLGRDAAADGRAAQYHRISGTLPAGADGFVSHGAAWLRIDPPADQFAATFGPAFTAWVANLPTSLPSQAGVVWLSGGILQVS